MWENIKHRNQKYRTPIAICLLVVAVWACIEPFSPPEVNSPEKYLVVDGFFNVGNDTSKIELRYTQNTSEQSTLIPETGAKLSVSGEGGETYEFVEADNGLYYLPPVNISPSGKYHLSIRTVGGTEYVSDDVPVIKTPPIDSITYSYDRGRDAMVIKVNTHDPQNKTRFYKWKFEETYEYRAAYYSGLVINVDTKEISARREDVNLCWKTFNSTNIMLGSTVKLSVDQIKDLPLNIVPINTNKMYLKYSILVKQYGLTQDGFEYWTDLAKTTEGTGSLFDPQPSQITGNIKSTTNPKELVFGYFSALTVESQRIFMTPKLGQYPRCDPPDTMTLSDVYKNMGSALINYYGQRSEFILTTSPGCADCRIHGGTIVKPSFWE